MRHLGHDARPNVSQRTDGAVIDGWFGLRYAVAPHRFAVAQPGAGRLPVQRLAEVPVFPQNTSRLSSVMGEGHPNPRSEDAYFLNIWAPRNAVDLPVLFFIHGGAWTSGGGSNEWYDGARLAARGAVVVTVNYRIGPIGHLGPGEDLRLPLPVEDLLLALRWVRDHVDDFGGDPESITVAGQSAGGWYSHLLSTLPETRGLFHRAAHLSMGVRSPWTPAKQRRINELVTGEIAPETMGRVSVEQLLATGQSSLSRDAAPPRLSYAPSGYLPVSTPELPGHLLTPEEIAGQVHVERVLVRWASHETATFFHNSPAHVASDQETVDRELGSWPVHDLPEQLVSGGRYSGEGSGLSPYQQVVAASSWAQFQRFPHELSRELEKRGVVTERHVFTRESNQDHVHAGHCYDLPYQFGTWGAWGDAPMMQGIDRDTFEYEADILMEQLMRFAVEP
ncbi:carboxylesterase family protein [Corynebacterium sp. YIM 101645]|uniref:Carboxylic ester hydrolase n=1 Tax=Corynebacterium lemuris TaxID=1859292 RepID=A0ABT2FSQ4_9CORY|nr:carboxylesterase family protein [Corynebacterium lemuris]MCS5478247.1 carboxylesterase family protein [Corynebacterium lemuris]